MRMGLLKLQDTIKQYANICCSHSLLLYSFY